MNTKPVFQELLDAQTDVTRIMSYSAAAVCTVIMLIIWFIFGEKNYTPQMLGIFVALALANILIFRLHGNLFVAYLVLITLSYMLITGMAVVTGGIQSPFIFLFLALPMGAFITSRKQGKIWVAVTVVTILVIYNAREFGITILNPVPSRHWEFFIAAVFFLALSITVTLSMVLKRSSYKLHTFYEQASAELEKKSRRLENLSTLLNYSTDLLCIVNLQSLIVEDLNPTFKFALGYELSEVREKKLTDLIIWYDCHCEKNLEETLRNMKEDQMINFNSKVHCKDGTQKSFRWMGLARKGKLHASAREEN